MMLVSWEYPVGGPSSAVLLLWNFTWTVNFLSGRTPSFALLVKTRRSKNNSLANLTWKYDHFDSNTHTLDRAHVADKRIMP